MSLFPPRVADVRRRPLFGCCSSRFLPQGFASGTDPNATRHSDVESPGRLEWVPYATWSHSYLGKKCTSKLGNAQQDEIIEGADMFIHIADDAVSFRMQPTDVHSRGLVPDDQSQPTSDRLAGKKSCIGTLSDFGSILTNSRCSLHAIWAALKRPGLA